MAGAPTRPAGWQTGPHLEERGILQVLQTELPGPSANTRSPTGTLPASKRMTKGGTVPRHEGAGAVHIRHRLRHRLGHVGAGMELQLDQCRVLD